jgi:hypothetical protein
VRDAGAPRESSRGMTSGSSHPASRPGERVHYFHFSFSFCYSSFFTSRGVQHHCYHAKIRFQSFFMLMTVQPCFFASSYSAWVNVPIFVSGSPFAGP